MKPASTTARRGDWLVPSLLLLLALVPSVAGGARVADLVRGGPITEANARFMAMPLPVLLHLLAAVPFGMVGAFQFSAGLRRRAPRWHRAAGWLLLPLAVVVAVTGLWMTLTYPWPAADGVALYAMRLLVGVVMLGSVVLSLDAIRRRRYAEHGAWMTRAYAIGMGAGTQVFTHLPWFLLVGQPTEGPRAVMMGLGWGINIVVAEWVIRRGAMRVAGRAGCRLCGRSSASLRYDLP